MGQKVGNFASNLCAPSFTTGPKFVISNDTAAAKYAAPSILKEADTITNLQRQEDYGHPLDDFGKVSRMAMALWGRGPETPEEHAMYMILVKLAREEHAPARDNLVDIAGYAKTIQMIRDERERRAADLPEE